MTALMIALVVCTPFLVLGMFLAACAWFGWFDALSQALQQAALCRELLINRDDIDALTCIASGRHPKVEVTRFLAPLVHVELFRGVVEKAGMAPITRGSRNTFDDRRHYRKVTAILVAWMYALEFDDPSSQVNALQKVHEEILLLPAVNCRQMLLSYSSFMLAKRKLHWKTVTELADLLTLITQAMSWVDLSRQAMDLFSQVRFQQGTIPVRGIAS